MQKLGVQNVVMKSVLIGNDGEVIDFVKNNVTEVNGTSLEYIIKKLNDKGTSMKYNICMYKNN
jgi:hypothetical protein